MNLYNTINEDRFIFNKYKCSAQEIKVLNKITMILIKNKLKKLRKNKNEQ